MKKYYFSFTFIYAFVVLMLITTDRMFFELTNIDTTKQVLPFAVLASIILFPKFSPFMKKWFVLLFLYFFACMLESYYLYNHPLKYPHVFMKIMQYFLIFFIYGFHKQFDKVSIEAIMIIAAVIFFINVATVNSHALSLSAFKNHERGVGITSVYLFVIILLYFFNQYFNTRTAIHLYLFFAVFGMIIFFQHRTVWIAMIIALGINFMLLRKTLYKIDLDSLIPVGIFLFLVSIFLSMVIFSSEEVMEKITENVEQIMNPLGSDDDDEASTSEWRYIQMKSYWPFVEQNPFLGMRLAGFELPVQFYDLHGNTPFEDNTGHHFHSMYMDKLFYQGILGLTLFLFPSIFYIIYCTIKQPYLTVTQVVLVSFLASALMYGFSYNYPDYIYGLIGFTILRVEKMNPISQNEASSINLTEVHQIEQEKSVSNKKIELLNQ